jgi:hypothetical protein
LGRPLIKRKKGNWIGHFLPRSCLLKNDSKGNIEGKERRGRRCKQLPDDLNETRKYWTFKQEALDGNV